MSTQALTPLNGPEHAAMLSQGDRFMPIMNISRAIERYNATLEFTKQIMKDGKDYGCVPGIDKPSLFKPGAEKLCNFFGLTPTFELVEKVENWDGDEPFFYYFYKCKMWRGQDLIGEADGSCNSKEGKYRYRWVGESQVPEGLNKTKLTQRGGRVSEFEFAIDKAETSGKFGKPADYWQGFKNAVEAGTAVKIAKPIKSGETRPAWEIDCTVFRVPNPDVCDQVNTIQKMAQKRALVAATLITCNASEYYTQDIEDMDIITMQPTTGGWTAPETITATAEATPAAKPTSKPATAKEGTQAAADQVAQQKIDALKNEAAAKDDPELAAYLKRAKKSPEDKNDVYADIAELIRQAVGRGKSGDQLANDSWASAISHDKGVAPTVDTVVRRLWMAYKSALPPAEVSDAN